MMPPSSKSGESIGVVLTIYKSFQFFELQEHVTAVLGLAYLLAALFHLGLEA
jgi:hypothetical protein